MLKLMFRAQRLLCLPVKEKAFEEVVDAPFALAWQNRARKPKWPKASCGWSGRRGLDTAATAR
jgi:hypothetical protein